MAEAQSHAGQSAAASRPSPLALLAGMERDLAKARAGLAELEPQDVENFARDFEIGCASLRALLETVQRNPQYAKALGPEFMQRTAIAATHARATMTGIATAQAYWRSRLEGLLNSAAQGISLQSYDPRGNAAPVAVAKRGPVGAA